MDHQKVNRLGHEVTLLTKSVAAVHASIYVLTDRMEDRFGQDKGEQSGNVVAWVHRWEVGHIAYWSQTGVPRGAPPSSVLGVAF